MFPTPISISNSTSLSEEATVSSGHRIQLNPIAPTQLSPHQHKIKKKRSLPGNPDPDAEVIALSPKTLLATNRFVCEICNKGFQRDQNLQLHRRGHNLPWKLKQRNSKEIKKRAYVCPEPTCVHHHPSRALGDLTGIKKHYSRKHGEKKWKCEKCSKIYAVQSDWKAHSKTCGTREYRCDCGTLFSRKDSFITHRAFCDALAEESARLSAHQELVSSNPTVVNVNLQNQQNQYHHHQININPWDTAQQNPSPESHHFHHLPNSLLNPTSSTFQTLSNAATSASPSSHHLSATALLQKAASVGATQAVASQSQMSQLDTVTQTHHHHLANLATWQKNDRLTRDFLGLTAHHHHHGNANVGIANGGVNVSMNLREMLTYTGGVGLQQFSERPPLLGFGFAQPHASETWGDC
ncbi:protein indeterminate-domain 12 [Euphorbia lathyris]|uniref:protein indeterminate-domain 12 n=1 Tax=Euphorbia lathyris TaxID=212925 RepID=UPI0033133C18